MLPEARRKLQSSLMDHEGVRLHAYQDSLGYWTIGCGRLIDKRLGGGISNVEMLYLLNNDIDRCIRECNAAFPWYAALDPVRQAVVTELCFNMGLGNTKRGLRSFHNTLAAIARGDYAAAARGLKRSLWAKQVGNRAERLSKIMESGQWLDEANA